MYISSSHSMLGICSWECSNCLNKPDTTIQMPPLFAWTRLSKLATSYWSLSQGMFPTIGLMVMYSIICLISSSIGALQYIIKTWDIRMVWCHGTVYYMDHCHNHWSHSRTVHVSDGMTLAAPFSSISNKDALGTICNRGFPLFTT
jgi:hypothetical protein